MSGPGLTHTAALAGVPTGVQSQGPWTGRRQLFVRFAEEAETAVMYTAAALARELERQSARTRFHSISVSGRDALGNVPFLTGVFEIGTPTLPIMIDTDGQRPEAIAELKRHVSLVQVTHDTAAPEAATERALATLAEAREMGCDHALVLAATEHTSDGQLLRIVEQAHATSTGTMIVVHPFPGAERPSLDRRWGMLLERATALHDDVRLLLRIPAPAGMR